jgi:hypothetical protein
MLLPLFLLMTTAMTTVICDDHAAVLPVVLVLVPFPVHAIPQNIRHHRADGSQPAHQIASREKANMPVSMYPEPEVAPDSLVYRIVDDIVYKVDIHEYNGCVVPWWCQHAQLRMCGVGLPG